MNAYLMSGILMGVSAGFAPGPLLALIISETLEHGIKEGIKVALAPIFTDLPIVLLALFVVSEIANLNLLLGIISLCGGIYISRLGYKSLRCHGMQINSQGLKPQSFRKGIMANFLSPNPYLFWFTVGAPIMVKAAEQGISLSLIFLTSFYILMLGIKVILAIVVGKSKSFLSGPVYINIMRSLGILLLFFAFILFRDGVGLILEKSVDFVVSFYYQVNGVS